MSKFFEDTTEDKEYKYKVLVYPNITKQSDLRKDSYVWHIRAVITELGKIRDDIHWTLIVPYETELLKLPNTSQIVYAMPINANAMRTHFDFIELEKLIDWQHNDFDILYSNLPEHTAQLVNLFHNQTNIRPYVIGDCHWFEVPENMACEETVLMSNFSGMLYMNKCGVNTQWLKDFILNRAAESLSAANVIKLSEIMEPHLPGIEPGFVFDNPNIETIPKSIIFNHRCNGYTGWPWFIRSLDDIYGDKEDHTLFTLYTTWKNDEHLPFLVKKTDLPRKEYFELLSKMYVGVAAFDKYSAWSVSVTEGLALGVPYLLPKKLCYPEMVGDDYPLFYNTKREFELLLFKLFDPADGLQFRQSVVEWLRPRVNKFLWSNSVPKWFNNWDIFDKLVATDLQSDPCKKMIDFIRYKQTTTKYDLLKHLGWGNGISFSKYRNALRSHPNIVFTKDKYVWKENSNG